MADKPMTGMQKVALLLKSLPEETVAKVLKHMDPRQGKLLASEVSKVANDPQLSEKLPTVLDEAVQMMAHRAPERPATANKAPMPAGSGKSRNAETETLVDLKIDDELTASMTGAPAPTAPPHAAPAPVPANPGIDALPALADLPVELLAAALESESARTVFVLLQKLHVDLAAKIYKLLSPDKRKEIGLRFAEKSTVNDHIIQQIAQGVLKKCRTLRSSTATAGAVDDREKLMATMIKSLERGERMEMLKMLDKADPGLTERVKNMLYEFELIARMENSSLQKLLAEVNMQDLALALQGAPPEVEERLMENLSKRAQDNLREEMSLLGKVTPAKVHEARQGIVQTIQQLDQSGDLNLRE